MAESLTTPAILPQTIAENGDATVIPATNDQTEGKASIAYGFPPLTSTPIADGGKMVRRADFNGLFNLLSQYALFAQNGGAFTFDANVSAAIGGYPLGARLIYVDAGGKTNIVISKIPNNTYNFNSDPSYIDGLKWAYDLNLNDYALLNASNIFTKSQYVFTADNTNVISFKNTNLATNNTVPTNNTLRYVRFIANDDSEIGRVGFSSLTNNRTTTDLVARRKIGGTDVISNIGVSVDTNGNAWTFALEPPSNSNGSNIATTKWISDLLKGAIDTTNDLDGWVYLGNKIVLQTVHESGLLADNGKTITLPTSFDNEKYNVIAVPDGYTGTATPSTGQYITNWNHTTTSFKAKAFVSGGTGTASFIIIGQKTVSTKP